MEDITIHLEREKIAKTRKTYDDVRELSIQENDFGGDAWTRHYRRRSEGLSGWRGDDYQCIGG